MVIQKTAMCKILAVILALVVLVGSSERVEAADFEPKSGIFSYNGEDYVYNYVTSFKGQYQYNFNKPVYIIIVNGSFMICCEENYTAFIGWMDPQPYKSCYYIDGSGLGSVSGVVTNKGDSNALYAFRDYFCSDKFDNLLFVGPNYKNVLEFPGLVLANVGAEIEDGNLVGYWSSTLPLIPFDNYETGKVSVKYTLKPDGTVENLEPYSDTIKNYYTFQEDGFIVPLSSILKEGYYLYSIQMVPSFYENDDSTGNYYVGLSSYITFTMDGESSAAIQIPVNTDMENAEENTEQGIFQSITNFFGGFFSNLINTVKSAVIPSGGDVLELLQEMNDWFSERFGFIWYPFDLAFDIVGAFALGEPDSTFTVPTVTLNMFGGIKLWDEFKVDLDPLGILEYVRFFTSAIMCCSVAGLALNKWNEWIGGEN